MIRADNLYTLVIVDMQTGFSASRDERTITGVRAEIRAAVEQIAPIVFVFSEPSKYGPIEPRLLELLEGYDNDLWTAEKKYYRYGDQYSGSSGALQVADACEVFGYNSERFRLCGVNTHICVFFTAMELGNRFPDARFELVEGACNDAYAADASEARSKFEFYSRMHNFANFVFD